MDVFGSVRPILMGLLLNKALLGLICDVILANLPQVAQDHFAKIQNLVL